MTVQPLLAALGCRGLPRQSGKPTLPTSHERDGRGSQPTPGQPRPHAVPSSPFSGLAAGFAALFLPGPQ